ncbi:MAG: M20/M25/M40 family metallo-hydrolase [Paludibacteraceae bacterium]
MPRLKEHIQRIITQTCAAYGCTAEIELPEGYPCVVNDEAVTATAMFFAEQLVGTENIQRLELRMTSEDFGFFSQQYPSCFYRLGVKGAANSNTGGLHSSTFCIDEEALKTGVGGLAWIAWNMMK